MEKSRLPLSRPGLADTRARRLEVWNRPVVSISGLVAVGGQQPAVVEVGVEADQVGIVEQAGGQVVAVQQSAAGHVLPGVGPVTVGGWVVQLALLTNWVIWRAGTNPRLAATAWAPGPKKSYPVDSPVPSLRIPW